MSTDKVKEAQASQEWADIEMTEQRMYTVRRNIETLVGVGKLCGITDDSLEKFGIKNTDKETPLAKLVTLKLQEMVALVTATDKPQSD